MGVSPASAPQPVPLARARSSSSALRIRRVRVRRGKLDLEVVCALEALHVDERTAARVLRELPNLSRHVCVNGRGETFGEEIVGTELPHLLEHVIIELQGQDAAMRAQRDAERARAAAPHLKLQGHTSWAAELAETAPHGYALMRVTVTFQDDLVALRAAKDACALLKATVG